MPLYHKKSKAKSSFLSPIKNYSTFLDKRETALEKPSIKTYSKSLAEVLSQSADSDENLIDKKNSDIVSICASDIAPAEQDVTSPLSGSIFSTPGDFESVEISRVKMVNGKIVKSLTRVESSANTEFNLMKSLTPNDSPTLADMVSASVKSYLRASQLMNVDGMICKTPSQASERDLSEIKAKIEVTRSRTDSKKTLSRFISNFVEPRSETTQSSGYATQTLSSEEIEGGNDDCLKKPVLKQYLPLKTNGETPRELKFKRKSEELRELTELNNRLSQEFFGTFAEDTKNNGPNQKNGRVKRKKESAGEMAAKNKFLTKQDITKSKICKTNQSDREVLKGVINNGPGPEIDELEFLTNYNIRLSQEYFKNLKEEEVRVAKVNKVKKRWSKTDAYAEKRKLKNNVHNTATKKYKKLNMQDSTESENVSATTEYQDANKIVHELRKPVMINTSKKVNKTSRCRSDNYIEHMLELQKMRDVGIYVFCDSCDKIRYLPNIKDPLDLPDKWYCYMNPDKHFNNCDAPNYEVPKEEEEHLIENKFNAGSVVWAKIEGYPWWPAMVEDDPDCEVYYWLDDPKDDEPTWYHVTFFDTQKVTRAWIKTKSLASFKANCTNQYFLPKKNNIYKHRVKSSMAQALEACGMQLLPRLRKFSLITRYFKPKKDSTDSQKNPRNIRMDLKEISSFSDNVKSFRSESQLKKPKKKLKVRRIYSDESEEEMLKDVNIYKFMNNNLPVNINFDVVDD